MNAWDQYTNKLSLNIISSKYESLVYNFDSQIKNIINFLDLEWNDDVRDFHLTAKLRAKISTPSSYQVVEPIYTSSIGKWKNYEKYFGDCHQYLRKWTSYFEYD